MCHPQFPTPTVIQPQRFFFTRTPHTYAMACQPLIRTPVVSLVTRTRTTLIPAAGRKHVRLLHHEVHQISPRGAVRCSSGTAAGCSDVPSPRRSGNYPPTMWHDSFIQTLTSDYMGEEHATRLEGLKGQVRHLIGEATGAAAKLELLDLLQRLGVGYHFEQEIGFMLNAMSTTLHDILRELDGDLLHTALLFRLLRELGLAVTQDVFKSFKDENGSFRGTLRGDVEGILSLYEASFLAFDGEKALQEARAFSTTCLQEFLVGGAEPMLRERVEYALEMPLHWRMPRLYTRWFIDVCERDQGKVSSLLLKFAKLDFNMVQSAHRRDARAMSRWWEDLGLKKLSFARDRIMENYFWTIGVTFEPQFWHCRHGLTRINALITTIDDVYDVYGSIDELECFTEAVEGWDDDAIEELPDYMRVCCQALFSTTNELARQCLGRNGFNCISYLKKSWIHLCKCYLVEARWCHSKHTPTLQEYMGNAWVSISGPVILTHAFFLLSDNIIREALGIIEDYGDLIQWASVILRLSDDLGTSRLELERGDVPKSVQCHMHEINVSEAVAREHIMAMISDTWMKVNKEISLNRHLPPSFVRAATNLARMAQCMYQFGDGHGIENTETKRLIQSILVDPIQNMEEMITSTQVIM